MHLYPQSSTEVKVKLTIINIKIAGINKERVCGLCRKKKLNKFKKERQEKTTLVRLRGRI